MSIKILVENYLPHWILYIYRRLKFLFGFRSGIKIYSQEGEDLILSRIFDKKVGFYVDIGAHHPFRYSNTYKLFQSGWSGINIDASPETINLFKRHRPKDINLNLGVSNCDGELEFYQFEDGAYNTFSSDIAKEVLYNKKSKLDRKFLVPVKKIAIILQEHLPFEQTIDVMSIDVEGLDLQVLMSNNWDKFKPKIILVELQWKSVTEVLQSKIYEYLSSKGYVLYSKLVNTSIFVLSDTDILNT